jgi:hypothetical protein
MPRSSNGVGLRVGSDGEYHRSSNFRGAVEALFASNGSAETNLRVTILTRSEGAWDKGRRNASRDFNRRFGAPYRMRYRRCRSDLLFWRALVVWGE